VNDVSAVVLSLGEPTLARALASLSAQTYPLHEIILVDNVSPFSRAFNEGAGRVSTPFFVQVDADMTLDATCVQELRASMGAATGLAYGELRDPLMGQVVGIKMFRTECVRRSAFRDSISPDTDFRAAIRRAGWGVTYLGRPAAPSEAQPRTFGDHRPDYTPLYVFGKYLLEGRRYRYRGDRPGLFWQIERLEASTHALALCAQMALSHGFFLHTERDELKPFPNDPRAAWLAELLASDVGCNQALEELPPLHGPVRLRTVFRSFVRAGCALGLARAGATVRAVLADLSSGGRRWPTLVAKLALAHGVLGTSAVLANPTSDERALKSFVVLGVGRRLTPWEALWARLLAVPRRMRPSVGGRVRW
jgi:hypothetical protein